MSSERLTRLHDAMQELVDGGELAGITTMIARHGRIADFQTFGYRDIEAQDVMASVCRAVDISLETSFTSRSGRPMKIANGGKVIKELFS